MTDRLCTYPGRRDDAIVDYVYGELDSSHRAMFEAHLAKCAVCAEEIEALGSVRDQLQQWAPPEAILALDHAASPVAVPRQMSRWSGWRDVPLWAQASAALLCLGVGAGAANLNVTYGPEGLSVRTGWRQSTAVALPPAAAIERAEQPSSSASHADLIALEETLRAEIRTAASARVSSPSESVPPTGDKVLKQVRSLIADSERRQQLELALRVGDVIKDVQAQRRADLVKIDRSIGLIQNSTGMEVLRQREMLNSLAVRVSSPK